MKVFKNFKNTDNLFRIFIMKLNITFKKMLKKISCIKKELVQKLCLPGFIYSYDNFHLIFKKIYYSALYKNCLNFLEISI